jgi:23S rRNA pseudouridine2605 synthase
VNGKLLHGAERRIYLLMNKPKGYVTTVSDPEGRPTVMDLLRGIRARVYPVGRLDYASEGLLLLTNDGELSNKLMKASSHVPKVYVVKVAGTPNEAGLEKLRRGLSISTESRFAGFKGLRNGKTNTGEDPSATLRTGARVPKTGAGKPKAGPNQRNSRSLDSGDESPRGFISSARDDSNKKKSTKRIRTAPAKVRLVREGDNPWYELTLMEGKNRQIRKMFEEIGHHVEKIKRVRYGPLSLDIPPGEFRRLSIGEVEKLKSAISVNFSR